MAMNADNTRELLAFGAALALTLAVTPLLRRVALRWDVVDHPAARKSHVTPTPYLGGIGLIAAALVGLAFAPHLPARVGLIVVGGLGLGLVGFLDDKHTLNPAPRIAVQLAAALLAVGAGVRVHVTASDAINIIVTVLWIVIITNAFNLLDNMDGLSAGAAVVAGTGVFLVADINGQYLVATAAAGVVGGCLGFLAYNKRPASIFMGDAGALVLGYVMAVLTIAIRPDLPTPRSWTLPAVLLWLPILDTSFVVITRIRDRRPVMEGGKDHLSHRVAALGFPPGRAVMTLLALYAVVVGVVVARSHDRLPGGTGQYVAIAMAFLLVVVVTRGATTLPKASVQRTDRVSVEA